MTLPFIPFNELIQANSKAALPRRFETIAMWQREGWVREIAKPAN